MTILDELMGKSIEMVSYDSEDATINFQMDDGRIWMFSITDDLELIIQVVEGMQ